MLKTNIPADFSTELNNPIHLDENNLNDDSSDVISPILKPKKPKNKGVQVEHQVDIEISPHDFIKLEKENAILKAALLESKESYQTATEQILTEIKKDINASLSNISDKISEADSIIQDQKNCIDSQNAKLETIISQTTKMKQDIKDTIIDTLNNDTDSNLNSLLNNLHDINTEIAESIKKITSNTLNHSQKLQEIFSCYVKTINSSTTFLKQCKWIIIASIFGIMFLFAIDFIFSAKSSQLKILNDNLYLILHK